MKRLSRVFGLAVVWMAVSLPLAARATVQSPPKQTVSQAAVLGQWRGVMESTPALDLTIKQNAGAIAGTIVFYRIESDSDGNPKVVGQDEMPLQDPIWKAGVLSFGVKRGAGDGAFHDAAVRTNERRTQTRRRAVRRATARADTASTAAADD